MNLYYCTDCRVVAHNVRGPRVLSKGDLLRMYPRQELVDPMVKTTPVIFCGYTEVEVPVGPPPPPPKESAKSGDQPPQQQKARFVVPLLVPDTHDIVKQLRTSNPNPADKIDCCFVCRTVRLFKEVPVV